MTRYARRSIDGVRWMAVEDFLPRIESGPFRNVEALFAASRVKKDLRVKRLMEYVDGEATYLVKLYKETGFAARLRRFLRGSKARLELKRSLAVMRRGIATVPITAAGERDGDSFLVCEKLLDWSPLEKVLLSPEMETKEKGRLLYEYGKFAREVHDSGVWQDDFNPSNVLVKTWGEAIEFKLVDFERARVRRRLSETARLRLVAKLNRLQSVGRARLLIFLDGYMHKYPEDQRREREIILRVQQFAEDLARRDAAKILQACVDENRNFGRVETERCRGFYRKTREGSAREGMTGEQAAGLARNGSEDYLLRPHDHAVYEWKRANQAAAEGGPVPFAVLWQKEGTRGFVAYRRSEIRERGLDWERDSAKP